MNSPSTVDADVEGEKHAAEQKKKPSWRQMSVHDQPEEAESIDGGGEDECGVCGDGDLAGRFLQPNSCDQCPRSGNDLPLEELERLSAEFSDLRARRGQWSRRLR